MKTQRLSNNSGDPAAEAAAAAAAAAAFSRGQKRPPEATKAGLFVVHFSTSLLFSAPCLFSFSLSESAALLQAKRWQPCQHVMEKKEITIRKHFDFDFRFFGT